MPARKSDSSEIQPDHHRNAIRRLSSIASLHALNPFSRRRSNQTDNSTAASSASNLSLSSNAANTPLAHKSESFPIYEDEVPALPQVPSYTASRRSSYVCLPDDPLGGMPRSRTFSNLPLPSRTRRQPSMSNSKSHSRLPSAILPPSMTPAAMLPPTRIPTPPTSTRRHSNTRLTPADSMPTFLRNRLKRSDTEPLLPVNVEQTNLGRHTAFKENITMSPVKPLPPMLLENKELHDSALPSRAYGSRHGWQTNVEGAEPLLQQNRFASSLPLTHHRHRSVAALSQSSPAYRSTRERLPTPRAPQPQPVQRWNSQPALTNITNRRTFRHGEIPENRLMAEVQPLPPPISPQTPLSAEALAIGKVKSLNNSAAHLRPVSEQSPLLKPRVPSPCRSGSEVDEPRGLSFSLPPSSLTDPLQIIHAEPVAYWCGRFSSLNDRYRNEELSAQIGAPKSSSDQMHTPEANTKRMRRALEYLHGLCATQEARESFVVFQLQFASSQGNADLGKPLALKVPERRITLSSRDAPDLQCEGPRDSGGVVGLGERRERSFMDRLLGRGRKSLV